MTFHMSTNGFFRRIAAWCAAPAAAGAGLVCASLSGCARPAGAPPEPCLRRADAAVPSLDPAQAASLAAGRAVALCYETPLQFDYAARPYALAPYVCDLPEVSPDGLEITLRLRDDVWFGPADCFDTPDKRRKAVAEDLVYSLKRLADAKNSSPGFWILDGKVEGVAEFRASSLDPAVPTDYAREISGIRALDDRTVRLRLVKPSSEFLWTLALPYASLVPREAVEKHGQDGFGAVEAGSGPFRLADWRRGHRMLFARREGRDGARDRTPVLSGAEDAVPYASVEILAMSDPSTRWLSFLSGAFDLAENISRDDWETVIGPDGSLRPDMAARGVTLHSGPALETTYLAFNMDDPVVGGANAALRRALSCAFDSAAWVSLNRGRVIPASGPLPPGVAGRLETPPPFVHDEARARALLVEAGYPGGVDPKTGRRLALTLLLGGTDPATRESAELMASFFARVGVSLSLEYDAFPQFLRRLNRREAQTFLVTWVADDPDPANFLQLFVSRNASPGPNRCNFSSSPYDALFDRAETSPEGSGARAAAVAEMQEIVRSECPWIFVGHRRDAVLAGPRLRNYLLHAFPLGMEKHWRAVTVP